MISLTEKISFFTDKIFIEKFLKFCIVGGSGVIIDFGITFVCKELLKLNKHQPTHSRAVSALYRYLGRGACDKHLGHIPAARTPQMELLRGQTPRHRRGYRVELLHELPIHILTITYRQHKKQEEKFEFLLLLHFSLRTPTCATPRYGRGFYETAAAAPRRRLRRRYRRSSSRRPHGAP